MATDPGGVPAPGSHLFAQYEPAATFAPALIAHDFAVVLAGPQSRIERDDGFAPLPLAGLCALSCSADGEWSLSFPYFESLLPPGTFLAWQAVALGITPSDRATMLTITLARGKERDGERRLQLAIDDAGQPMLARYVLHGRLARGTITPLPEYDGRVALHLHGLFSLIHLAVDWTGELMPDGDEHTDEREGDDHSSLD